MHRNIAENWRKLDFLGKWQIQLQNEMRRIKNPFVATWMNILWAKLWWVKLRRTILWRSEFLLILKNHLFGTQTFFWVDDSNISTVYLKQVQLFFENLCTPSPWVLWERKRSPVSQKDYTSVTGFFPKILFLISLFAIEYLVQYVPEEIIISLHFLMAFNGTLYIFWLGIKPRWQNP